MRQLFYLSSPDEIKLGELNAVLKQYVVRSLSKPIYFVDMVTEIVRYLLPLEKN